MNPLDYRLIRARPEHLDFWAALREEPELRRVLPLEPSSREVLLQRLLGAMGELDDPQATNFRWMVECEGQLCGTVQARNLSRFQGRIEIGYMLSTAYHRRGLGTRAVGEVLERLFTAWPFLHRVWLTTAADNLPSQGLASKLGFVLEGALREHYFIDGQRKDEQVWGLLRSEWEAGRAPRRAPEGGATPRGA